MYIFCNKLCTLFLYIIGYNLINSDINNDINNNINNNIISNIIL